MIRQMQSAGAVTVPEVAIDPAHPLVDRSAVARPIRVAHLIHTIAHGGVETALINWCRTFDPVRVQAHLLCFADPGASEAPFVAAADRAGLHVDRVPWGRSKPVRRAARAVAALLRDRQIDLLHCHNTYANAVGLVAARLTPVRTLTTVYVWSGYGIKRRALQWIDERLLGYFDQVTAHCDAALRATVERGIPASEIRLLTCGFADRVARLYAHEGEEGRRALGVGPDDTVLIKVARFWPEKRHDILLRAFRLMLQREPNLQLWIPGVGPEETRVRALADELNIASRCRFLGFRTDLPELLALADVQVHTSDEEGVPLAILSGMAAGKPIVSTRVGGIAEVLEHDRSGVLVPPGSPEEFAEATLDLLRDRQRRADLGRSAQQFVRTEYSLEAATARVERLYAEVVAR
jgi:glycosyltransferase involved in cell wall biosynthesis